MVIYLIDRVHIHFCSINYGIFVYEAFNNSKGNCIYTGCIIIRKYCKSYK